MHDRGADAEGGGSIGDGEGAVGARPPRHEVRDRVGDRLKEGVREADGKRGAQGVAQSRGILDRGDRVVAGDAHRDRATRGQQLVDPAGLDASDRELVTPWFRFLWESYRSVLEILRTNPKLEALYAMAAARAFSFCLTYKRNAEFRRLCDILRQHLANMAKYREQRDIAAPESLNLHLETRFEQLKAACPQGIDIYF